MGKMPHLERNAGIGRKCSIDTEVRGVRYFRYWPRSPGCALEYSSTGCGGTGETDDDDTWAQWYWRADSQSHSVTPGPVQCNLRCLRRSGACRVKDRLTLCRMWMRMWRSVSSGTSQAHQAEGDLDSFVALVHSQFLGEGVSTQIHTMRLWAGSSQ